MPTWADLYDTDDDRTISDFQGYQRSEAFEDSWGGRRNHHSAAERAAPLVNVKGGRHEAHQTTVPTSDMSTYRPGCHAGHLGPGLGSGRIRRIQGRE